MLNLEHNQFVEGVSLASASSIAAAEPVGDEAEGAAGDAPTCALCLSPRKQVLCHVTEHFPFANCQRATGCVHVVRACVLLAMHRR